MRKVLLAAMLLFATSNAITSRVVRKWTWIHSKSSGDYLQFEWRELPPGKEPVIDSVKVVGYTLGSGYGGTVLKLDVRAWCGSVAIPEPEGAKVQIGQAMKKIGLDPMIDPSLPASYTVDFDSIDIVIDGIELGKAPVAKVDNDPSGVMMCPALACFVETNPDSARKKLSASIAASPWVAVMDAAMIKTLVPPNWWSVTTGTEAYSEVAVAMSSNAGNWINLDKTVLGVTKPIKVGPNDPSLYEVPTGRVEYVYNRSASPLSKIAVQSSARIFLDTLLKTGPELWLTGSVQRSCFKLPYDSLIGKNAWLVLADAAGGVAASMAFNTNCGARKNAWKVVDDSVWVTSTDKVSLSSLLLSAGTRPIAARAVAPRILGGRGGAILDLAEASDVQVLSLDGQILSSIRMAAGRHELPKSTGGRLARTKSLKTGTVSILPFVR